MIDNSFFNAILVIRAHVPVHIRGQGSCQLLRKFLHTYSMNDQKYIKLCEGYFSGYLSTKFRIYMFRINNRNFRRSLALG